MKNKNKIVIINNNKSQKSISSEVCKFPTALSNLCQMLKNIHTFKAKVLIVKENLKFFTFVLTIYSLYRCNSLHRRYELRSQM